MYIQDVDAAGELKEHESLREYWQLGFADLGWVFDVVFREPMTHMFWQLRAEWHNSAVVQLAASFDRCDQQNRSFARYSWLDSHVPACSASCRDKALNPVPCVFALVFMSCQHVKVNGLNTSMLCVVFSHDCIPMIPVVCRVDDYCDPCAVSPGYQRQSHRGNPNKKWRSCQLPWDLGILGSQLGQFHHSLPFLVALVWCPLSMGRLATVA